MTNLNELGDYPKWINTMDAVAEYQFYSLIKASIEQLRQLGPTDELEQALAEYEQRNNLV